MISPLLPLISSLSLSRSLPLPLSLSHSPSPANGGRFHRPRRLTRREFHLLLPRHAHHLLRHLAWRKPSALLLTHPPLPNHRHLPPLQPHSPRPPPLRPTPHRLPSRGTPHSYVFFPTPSISSSNDYACEYYCCRRGGFWVLISSAKVPSLTRCSSGRALSSSAPSPLSPS